MIEDAVDEGGFGDEADHAHWSDFGAVAWPGSYFSFMLGIGNVAVTTSVPPCVFTRAPVSQR